MVGRGDGIRPKESCETGTVGNKIVATLRHTKPIKYRSTRTGNFGRAVSRDIIAPSSMSVVHRPAFGGTSLSSALSLGRNLLYNSMLTSLLGVGVRLRSLGIMLTQ